jgi:hypothetical protein
MMFADRQDVGLPRDSHFHCGRWMLPGVVVDLIPYTCRAGKTPRPSQSGHGSRVGLLLPMPVIHRHGQQHGLPDLDRILRHRPPVFLAGDGDGHSLGRSAPTASRTAELANHLIRRDLRVRRSPAHSSVDLPKSCSALRNDGRRYVASYGQNPASVIRWPSRTGGPVTVKPILTVTASSRASSDADCLALRRRSRRLGHVDVPVGEPEGRVRGAKPIKRITALRRHPARRMIVHIVNQHDSRQPIGAEMVESPPGHGPYGGRRDPPTAIVSRHPVADLTLRAAANLAAIAVPQPDVTNRLALRRIRHRKGQPVTVLPAPLLTRQPRPGFHGITGTAPAVLKQAGKIGMRRDTVAGIFIRHRC